MPRWITRSVIGRDPQKIFYMFGNAQSATYHTDRLRSMETCIIFSGTNKFPGPTASWHRPGKQSRGEERGIGLRQRTFYFSPLIKGFGNAKTLEKGETKIADFWIEVSGLHAGRWNECRRGSVKTESDTTGCAPVETGQGNALVGSAFGQTCAITKRSRRLVSDWRRPPVSLQCNRVFVGGNDSHIRIYEFVAAKNVEGYGGLHFEILGGLSSRLKNFTRSNFPLGFLLNLQRPFRRDFFPMLNGLVGQSEGAGHRTLRPKMFDSSFKCFIHVTHFARNSGVVQTFLTWSATRFTCSIPNYE